MLKAILTRTLTGDEGTFGTLAIYKDDKLLMSCFSGELPWKDNLKGQSCIPPGTYTCQWKLSPKHGPCYYVTGVQNRDNIEIHPANWMGDKSKGFKCELEGCIAPGNEVEILEGQRGVFASKQTLKLITGVLEGKDFELTIQWAPELP